MGHAAQVRFIFDDEGPATRDDTSVLEETQADCLAGVSLGHRPCGTAISSWRSAPNRRSACDGAHR